jgi:class 3 adenylate cyclase/pSer/pThr/pTyr-binding forkhead associated (FHA) protein
MEDKPGVTRILDLSSTDPKLLKELEKFRRPMAVLFTDIAGSTAYFERFGDTYGLAMVHKFNFIVHEVVDEGSGRVIKNMGDGLLATFDDADKSVQAAIAIQQRLKAANAASDEEHRFSVRVGVHYGMGIVRSNNDVYGSVVNVASRLQSLALAGQIVVSGALQQQISSGRYELASLGAVFLKGKSEEQDLFEVRWSAPATDETAVRQTRPFRLHHLDSFGKVDAEYPSRSEGLSIGRSNADIRFPNSSMEPSHARLLVEKGNPVIEDSSSKEGVFLQIVAAHQLRNDDVIRIGAVFLRFVDQYPTPSGPLTGPPAPQAMLSLLDSDGSETGERYPLGEREVRFGRVLGDYVFSDDKFMSRSHLRLFRQEGHFFMEDLGSTNGTFLKVRGRAIVSPGALIYFGGETFRLVEAGT